MSDASQHRRVAPAGPGPDRNRDALPSAALSLSGWASPNLDRITGASGGRDLREGYRRGWGLQFGDLALEVASSPLYRRALELARHPYAFSVLPEPRLQNLFLLVTEQLPRLSAHDIVEFGSFRGGTAIFLAVLLRAVAPKAKVYALDTFQGIPSADEHVDLHREGDFGAVDLDRLRARSRELGLDNLVWVEGPIFDTFAMIAAPNKFGLAHIDCDVGRAVAEAEQAVWPCMAPGGYIVFDDADASSCLGATEAVENMVMARRIHSEQVWPHIIFRADPENRRESAHNLSTLLSRRRQTRRFSLEPLPEQTRLELFQAMNLAPSVGNSRPWRIVQIGSAAARDRLQSLFLQANQETRAALPSEKAASYDLLEVEGFLRAPLQLSIFTEMEPQVGHRQGSTTFPEALVHSTVGAVHTLWLAAEAQGLGFAWVSTFDPHAIEAAFAQASSWRFAAHVAIGHRAETLERPRHETAGWLAGTPSWSTI